MITLQYRKHFVSLEEAYLPHYVFLDYSSTPQDGLGRVPLKAQASFNKDPEYSEERHIDFSNQYFFSLPHKEYLISIILSTGEHFYKVKLNDRNLEIKAYLPSRTPNCYGIVSFSYFSDGGLLGCKSIEIFDVNKKRVVEDNEEKMSEKQIYDYMVQITHDVLDFLYVLSLRDIRVASKEINHGIKVSSKKSKHVKTNLTLVTLSRYLNNTKSIGVLKDVKWEHSWIRRGHWRTLKESTLGKDMFGDRNQLGRTWVIESQVNSDLDLKNNVRLLKSS